MTAGTLRQIGRTMGVEPVPVDGSRLGERIEVIEGCSRIQDAEAPAADRGKCFASSKSYGTIEQRLLHERWSFCWWGGKSSCAKQELCRSGEILNPSIARLRIISCGVGTRDKTMNDRQFKLLYDGQCPICRREVEWLKRRDRHGNLVPEDISAPNFHAEAYGLSQTEVMAVMHGVLPDGRIVRRVEAIREAYRVVGLGWMVAPLSWPIIGWLADRAYGIFARNRVALGRLFGRSCDGFCKTPTLGP